MDTQIFVNLPVKDLERSKTFFGKLGFGFNPQFTDANGACMVIKENHIYAMLLTEAFATQFTRKPIADAHKSTEVLVALSLESKEAVDRMADSAIAAGATEARDPMAIGDFMYGRSINDLDGHIWELFWMNPAHIQKQ
jgi:uncharacterized protein